MFRLLILILLLSLCGNVFSATNCEAQFVSFIGGDLPRDVGKNPMINMWDERFDAYKVAESLKAQSDQEVLEYLAELTKLVHKNQVFNDNLGQLFSKLYQDKRIKFSFLKKHLIDKDFEFAKFFFSDAGRNILTKTQIDPAKIQLLDSILPEQGLSKFYQDEYRKVILTSNHSAEDFREAFASGMKLSNKADDLEQFKKYMQFIDGYKPAKAKAAFKNIQKIYDYEMIDKVLTYNPHQGTVNKFFAQEKRVKKYTDKRIKELEKELKLQQKSEIIQEIDDAIARQARGEVVDPREKIRFNKKIDDFELPASHKLRAKNQAIHEAKIYRKLLNGCGGGDSQRVKSAAKKFKNFKLFLALGVTPGMYLYKNRDNIGKDPDLMYKFGHEVVLGLVYTVIGNKIFTKTDAGFWIKYLEGYWKFSILSYTDAFSYEMLFGKKSMVRHIQKIFKGELPESELEKQFEVLRSSPTFEKDMEELVAYLEQMSQKVNTKNYLDKYFNLSAYASLDDETKITQEDLESEEAKELVMELLAERIYLQNMGTEPFLQTGNKGHDRFLFYRARNIVWDIKGLMVNLAIFELMCRQPFGKIGSWGAIIAMVVGDNILSNEVTLNYRKEMIGQ